MKEMYSYLSSYLSQEEISSLKEEMNKPYSYKGLAVNINRLPLELVKKEYEELESDDIDPIRLTYLENTIYPSKNIYHEGGGYYILDPSSLEASLQLGINNKKLVLDLCAAPGGKTIAYAIRNKDSLIIANDISYKRALELSKNVERLGLPNVIVTSLDPKVFLKYFENSFDQIILDAPCSGSGMFRKEKKMEEDWSIEKVNSLLPIQDSLLETSYKLLKKGGELLYITCSFLKEEDEDRIENLINNHIDINVVSPRIFRNEYKEGSIHNCIHLLPSLFKGEGHFFTLLRKDGEITDNMDNLTKYKFDNKLNLYIVNYQNEEYGINYFSPLFLKLNPLRIGIKLTNHSEYSKINEDHSLSHYSSFNKLEVSKEDAILYLSGNELKGYDSYNNGTYVISYNSLGLGYGVKKGDRIKNIYPKGLRKNL